MRFSRLPVLIQSLRKAIPHGHEPEIAEKAGICNITVNNWLSGKRDPRLSLFEATLNACDHRIVVEPNGDSEMVKAAKVLQNSINNDFNAHGGLLSDNTLRASDELRMLILQKENR